MRYVVTTFVEEHNHELVRKYAIPQLRSHRHVDSGHQAGACAMCSVGITPSKIVDVFTYEFGGYENIGFTRSDLYNELYRHRQLEIDDGDAKVAFGYLYAQMDNDPNFFFCYTVDNENCLDKLFWTNGRSRDEYAVFGDVLILDAMYKTNVYSFPLIILAGVNNYRRTCVFGVTLIQNESIESYLWVLQTFVIAMNNKIPLSVVTGGDKAMEAAIALIFPNVKHRLCKWHLQLNAASNVHIPKFNEIFSHYMSLSCSIHEFEIEWSKMITKHGIGKHKWIVDVYERRHMWLEAYLHGQFFALVKTTQRCEGMNAFLNKFLGSKKKLIDFMRTTIEDWNIFG